MRRAVWLGAGVALGAGGATWLRHRVSAVTKRLKPNNLASEVAAGARLAARATTEHMRNAIQGGIDDARSKEEALRGSAEPLGRHDPPYGP